MPCVWTTARPIIRNYLENELQLTSIQDLQPEQLNELYNVLTWDPIAETDDQEVQDKKNLMAWIMRNLAHLKHGRMETAALIKRSMQVTGRDVATPSISRASSVATPSVSRASSVATPSVSRASSVATPSVSRASSVATPSVSRASSLATSRQPFTQPLPKVTSRVSSLQASRVASPQASRLPSAQASSPPPRRSTASAIPMQLDPAPTFVDHVAPPRNNVARTIEPCVPFLDEDIESVHDEQSDTDDVDDPNFSDNGLDSPSQTRCNSISPPIKQEPGVETDDLLAEILEIESQRNSAASRAAIARYASVVPQPATSLNADTAAVSARAAAYATSSASSPLPPHPDLIDFDGLHPAAPSTTPPPASATQRLHAAAAPPPPPLPQNQSSFSSATAEPTPMLKELLAAHLSPGLRALDVAIVSGNPDAVSLVLADMMGCVWAMRRA